MAGLRVRQAAECAESRAPEPRPRLPGLDRGGGRLDLALQGLPALPEVLRSPPVSTSPCSSSTPPPSGSWCGKCSSRPNRPELLYIWPGRFTDSPQEPPGAVRAAPGRSASTAGVPIRGPGGPRARPWQQWHRLAVEYRAPVQPGPILVAGHALGLAAPAHGAHSRSRERGTLLDFYNLFRRGDNTACEYNEL